MITTSSSDATGQESSKTGDELLKDETRFSNLQTAGRALALKLEAYRERDSVVVLGIALGGVPAAREVASFLNAPLDLVIIRRLLAPEGPGSLVCAVNVGGTLVIDGELMARSAAPNAPVDYFLADALADLRRRERVCRGERPPIDLAGATVILVDCGIRTGSTMRTTIEALRTLEPARIVAAAPLASMEGRKAVAAIADDSVWLASPEPFGHVGLFYIDFSRPDDEHIGELLDPFRLDS